MIFSSAALDQQLHDKVSTGVITEHDADEVRRFAEFLHESAAARSEPDRLLALTAEYEAAARFYADDPEVVHHVRHRALVLRARYDAGERRPTPLPRPESR